MMEDEPVQDHPNGRLLRSLLGAFAAGDVDGMGGTFDDDVTWHAPGTNRFSGRFGGRAAVDEALDRLLAGKPRGHDFRIDAPMPAVARHMSVTGG